MATKKLPLSADGDVLKDERDARKIVPAVDTHADTATSTRETTVQYFAVHLNGETAMTPAFTDGLGAVEEAALVEMLQTNEYLRLQNAHTLLKKTIEVVVKREL